jgi:aminoglycoside phosphotransferase (APT) family kinase protein
MLDPDRLSAALARMAGGVSLPLANIERLSGGANMESWAFEWGGAAYVLRRSPAAALMAGRSYGHDVEAALVRTAFAAGVKAPEVVGELIETDGLGTGYLMRRIVAEVNPAAILAAPPPSLLSDLAREAAHIHAITRDMLPADLPSRQAEDLLADLKSRFLDYGGDRPIFALACRWLEETMPPPVEPVLLHGDFRMGNIMVDDDGLAAVLDWELAHLGDRHQDLAFGCINSWRFGHIDRPAFGCGSLEALWAAYEHESGVTVDPARFRWWLIYSTLWWGLCCLQMSEIWRSGIDRSLERAVIGKRTSETEVDLLMLLEVDAPETQRLPIRMVAAEPPRRLGEPSAAELLEALTQWIESDVRPKASGRDKFMAAVARNAVGMLMRDAAAPVEIYDRPLCDDLMAGRKSLASPGLLARLKRDALAKLAIDQPRYSALAKATALWTTGDQG